MQPRFKPSQQQLSALGKIPSALEANGRANVVMACGTGKTYLELLTAHTVQSKKTLVLVPTLYLMQQLLNVWASQHEWGDAFRYLCVCSDKTIGVSTDEIMVERDTPGFAPTTEPSVVSRFLSEHSGDDVSVVFSTYQSASTVGMGLTQMQAGFDFDLILMDEAHKTVGVANKPFSYALSNANIPAKQRVFFTATPKIVSSKNTHDANGNLVFASMNDVQTYGPRAYTLSFSQAAEEKIISPYKVLVSILNSGVDTIESEDSRSAANLGALLHAMATNGLKKAITFHSTVDSAEAFSKFSPPLAGNRLTKVSRFHVSGRQSASDRTSHMDSFAKCDFGYVTNARCLTEGVDVPAVDLVAFMDPKSSETDIVQAAGRAMRLANGKACGYILLPIHINTKDGEELATALSRSNFKQIAHVLSELCANDDALDYVIRDAAHDVGRGKSKRFTDNGMLDIVSLPVGISGSAFSQEEIVRAVQTALITEIADSWDVKFGKLVKYKETHLNFDVPRSDPELGIWVAKQRVLMKADDYPPKRREKMDAIGFESGDPLDKTWMSRYSTLVKMKKEKGHCNVPFSHPDGKWAAKQRAYFKAGTLSQERRDLLIKVGFEFGRGATVAFERSITTIEKSLDGWRGPRPMSTLTAEDTRWLREQLSQLDGAEYPETQKARINIFLESRKVAKLSLQDKWELTYHDLADFRKDKGSLQLAKVTPLYRWLKFQRSCARDGTLLPDRASKLLSLGAELEFPQGYEFQDSIRITDPDTTQAIQDRVAALRNLTRFSGGAAYTFGKLALKAIELLDGDSSAVLWHSIENEAIIQSIGMDGQESANVLAAILEYSPGAVDVERKEEIKAYIEAVTPDLKAHYAKVFGSLDMRVLAEKLR